MKFWIWSGYEKTQIKTTAWFHPNPQTSLMFSSNYNLSKNICYIKQIFLDLYHDSFPKHINEKLIPKTGVDMRRNIRTGNLLIFLTALVFIYFSSSNLYSQIITPEKYFGFQPGSDKNLFNYNTLIDYLQKLDDASPKLKLVNIGKSPMGKAMYIAFISSAENINNLDKLKDINKQLALNPKISELEFPNMLNKGKVFVLATLSMHSSEVAPTQSAPLVAYNLVSEDNPDVNYLLNNVVYMMVPSHNPDGMDMVVNHYKKYKGTKYEGSSMPGIYHKYVGHDNNRDFISLTQEDTKAIASIYNLDWFPQVMVEKHQMGYTGPRYYVPPSHDPIAENIDAGVWNWGGIFGSNIIKDLTREGLSGVSQHYLFDDYWPGSTETCIWKNVIGFLTEAASANYASPIYIEPNELKVWGKGLAEYKKSINMPLPWPGGWWRLGDIVQYEIESTKSILKTAAKNRKEILQFRNELCKKEVEKGKTIAPYYYIMPKIQHDESEFVNLVNLLIEHSVEIYELAEGIEVHNRLFTQGDIVVPLSQPFRPFIKEVMEKQKFPLRHYTPDGEIIKPYDITSWSLPLHRGINSIEVNERSMEIEKLLKKIESNYSIKNEALVNYSGILLSVNNNESYKFAFTAIIEGLDVKRTEEIVDVNGKIIPKGSFYIKSSAELTNMIEGSNVPPIYLTTKVELSSKPISLPRIGLIETYFHDMDAGWTRFIFDTYNLPYKVIRPGDLKDITISKNFDVIIFPDSRKSVLMDGKYKSGEDYYVTDYPPEYAKGMGKKGFQKILTFIDDGGIILSWGASTELFMGTLQNEKSKDVIEEYQLPVKDISEDLTKKGLYIPGSFARMVLTKDHPITLGMQEEIGVFYRGTPVFETSVPSLDLDRRVIGKFPEDEILLSGYSENEKLVSNKTGLVWLKKGKGQLVMFAFNPQFRASTNISYKLLFNSLLLPKL